MSPHIYVLQRNRILAQTDTTSYHVLWASTKKIQAWFMLHLGGYSPWLKRVGATRTIAARHDGTRLAGER